MSDKHLSARDRALERRGQHISRRLGGYPMGSTDAVQVAAKPEPVTAEEVIAAAEHLDGLLSRFPLRRPPLMSYAEHVRGILSRQSGRER